VPLNPSDLNRVDLLLCIKDEIRPSVPLPDELYGEVGKIYVLHGMSSNSFYVTVYKPKLIDLPHSVPCAKECFIPIADATAFDKLVYNIE
jgi:hypothetical protein